MNNSRVFSNGINDSQPTVSILATKIFDNVKADLDRSEAIITSFVENPEEITPLYALGTASMVAGQTVTVTPDPITRIAALQGYLELPGTLTYLFSGARQIAPCNLLFNVNLQMQLPEDSVWPFDITVHYSYFADNISFAENNRFSSLVDGTVIIYVTACAPVTIPSLCPIQYNSASERQTQNENAFLLSNFYPVSTR
ncbi:MAG: hypothetical protein IKB86_04355 [Clostridia bacterium]|nr:hypothetical protein [Clostridia bacterium]